MKLIIRLILIGAITYFLSPYFTWWTGMAAAFLVCFVSPSTVLNALVAGFLGVGLVWLGQSWVLDVANESAFSNTIIQLFPFEDTIWLLILAGLSGGLSGGFAGAMGSSLRQINKKERKGYYS